MRAGDEEAKRRGVQKSVLERQGLPTFDVCVEMVGRHEWAVWEDVGTVVDQILLDRDPPMQARFAALAGISDCLTGAATVRPHLAGWLAGSQVM